MTVSDLSAKFKSKTELYNLLARESNIYLPPKQDSSQKFLRSIMLGSKLYVKWENVNIIKVPQYKVLHVKDLLRFATTKINIKEYLPEFDYSKEPKWEWLWNLINSLIPQDFQIFIHERIEARKQDLIESKNLAVHAKPEFVNIFRTSQAVSSMKEIPFFGKNAKSDKRYAEDSGPWRREEGMQLNGKKLSRGNQRSKK